MAFAYCYRTGEIGFCEEVDQLPAHTIIFEQRGTLTDIKTRVAGYAGHDPTTNQFFVPGVYLQDNREEARVRLAVWLEANQLSHRWIYAEQLRVSDDLKHEVA